MAGTDYDFYPIPGGKAPAKRLIVDRSELRLEHWALPAATFKSDGLPAHHIAVQLSPGTSLIQRMGGRVFSGRLPVRSSSITPADAPSSTTWDKDRECLVLSLVPGLVERLLQDELRGIPIELAPRVTGPDPFIADVVNHMARHAAETGPYGSLLLDGLTVSLVAYLAGQNMVSETIGYKGGLTQGQARRVLDLIDARFSEEISLAELAAEARLSERYFCTAFRKTMGVPPYRYMLERRIEEAKKLLRGEQNLRITDIAMNVGFQTSTHFATTFRNITGISPSVYRSIINE